MLDAYDMHATFFVTGAKAAKHPGLVRNIVERGHEIGGHTATHTDLRDAGDLRVKLELRCGHCSSCRCSSSSTGS